MGGSTRATESHREGTSQNHWEPLGPLEPLEPLAASGCAFPRGLLLVQSRKRAGSCRAVGERMIRLDPGTNHAGLVSDAASGCPGALSLQKAGSSPLCPFRLPFLSRPSSSPSQRQSQSKRPPPQASTFRATPCNCFRIPNDNLQQLQSLPGQISCSAFSNGTSSAHCRCCFCSLAFFEGVALEAFFTVLHQTRRDQLAKNTLPH